MPTSCPLIDELYNNILRESGRSSEIGSDVARDELWRDMASDPALLQKRYKVNMNRFWHGVEVAWIYNRNWTKFRFASTYLALETDALSGANLSKLIFKGDSDNGERTKGEVVSTEEKALKAKVNAVACSVLFLSEYSRLHRLRALLVVAAPLEK